jgi:hypothetical protein
LRLLKEKSRLFIAMLDLTISQLSLAPKIMGVGRSSLYSNPNPLYQNPKTIKFDPQQVKLARDNIKGIQMEIMEQAEIENVAIEFIGTQKGRVQIILKTRFDRSPLSLIIRTIDEKGEIEQFETTRRLSPHDIITRYLQRIKAHGWKEARNPLKIAQALMENLDYERYLARKNLSITEIIHI